MQTDQVHKNREEGGRLMAFEGFMIEYLIPPSHSAIPLAFVYCDKCGAKSPKEANYMRDVCELITCTKCGNSAIRAREEAEA